jgi:hypothetical protein
MVQRPSHVKTSLLSFLAYYSRFDPDGHSFSFSLTSPLGKPDPDYLPSAVGYRFT